ncbi:hypothetical protein N431DRAFT_431150 [Stipitochalara longipes BDJ]|nr:hypothetical protein N431DRAFT_431150 [Stipitochalara longipes BDJ]
MLALIDRNLARYAEAGGSNTPQIELIEPADTQPSLSQEKGEHQQEQVETLQFWYRPWRYNGRLFGSINAWRVPFGSFTFGALVVVMLMRRWR